MINTTIENNFMHHESGGDRPARYRELRMKCKELAYLIDGLCHDSREKSMAITKLEEAMFWANASVARN